MTAGLPPRPSLTRRRCLIRSLLGAALAVTGVLVPLEAPALPDSPVLAQGDDPVVGGTPEQCPSPYQPSGINGSLCLLETTACRDGPESLGEAPLQPSVQFPETLDADMHRIGRYPDFCEARYRESDDPAAYAACTDRDNTKGFIVKVHIMERVVDDENNPVLDDHDVQVVRSLCRIIHPTNCPDGSLFEPYRCRSVRRRAWSCPDNYFPRNDFNTCYKPPSRLDRHPACDAGAPALIVLNCPDYVGDDYAPSPEAPEWACGGDSFDTGSADARLEAIPANPYWCRFDASYLDMACHANPRPADKCPTTPASCLKRASQTGGCNAIAHTIRCRGLQAGLANGDTTVAGIRDQGCQPCVLLPFRPRPASCPKDIREQPVVLRDSAAVRYNGIHAAKADFQEWIWVGGRNICGGVYRGENVEACVAASKVCQRPPSGRLTWSSTHHSPFAVVNLPVILTVRDIPFDFEEIVGYSGLRRVTRSTSRFLKFPVENLDTVIQRFPAPDPEVSLTNLAGLVQNSGQVCRYRDLPVFRVIVEELWPDRDEDAIKELFGERSLDWWNALGATERANLTAARGATRSEEVLCNRGEVLWCRWTPTRSGFYRLKAAGAWIASRTYKSVRSALLPAPAWLVQVRRSSDQFLRALQGSTERQRIRDLLRAEGLDAVDLGLNDDLDDYLPLTANFDRETLYTLDGPACPSRDVRFTCAGGGWSAHYTESEPIGIAVHEVRVATRSPNT